MKGIRRIVALLLTVALLLSVAMTGAYADDLIQVRVSNARFLYQEARSMLGLVNAFRTGEDAWYLDKDNVTRIRANGLKALTYDYNLERSAMQRAVELAVWFSHTRPDGSKWSTAQPKGNFNRGENLACGWLDVNTAFTAFCETDKDYNGQGHRRNMLRKDFARVGFGAVQIGNMVYWVQEFASGKAGGKDENLFKSNTVNASWSLLVKSGAQNLGPAAASLTMEAGAAVPMPRVVIYSATGAELTIADCTWTPVDGTVVSDGSQLIGAAVGESYITTDVKGNQVVMQVFVVPEGMLAESETSPEAEPEIIQEAEQEEQPETAAEPEPEAQPEPEAEPEPEAQPEPEAEPVPEAQPEPESGSDTFQEWQPDSSPEEQIISIEEYDTALSFEHIIIMLKNDECFEPEEL